MRYSTRMSLKEAGKTLLWGFINGGLLFCIAYALLGDKLLTTFLFK